MAEKAPTWSRQPFKLGERTRALLAGIQPSWHYGHGERFADLKPYEAGDPVRSIDWRYAARTDRYAIRRYEEPKTARILLFVDDSTSMQAGYAAGGRQEWVQEVVGALQWVARRYGDSLQVLPFRFADIRGWPEFGWQPDLVLVVSDYLEYTDAMQGPFAMLRATYPRASIRSLGLLRPDESQRFPQGLLYDPEHGAHATAADPEAAAEMAQVVAEHCVAVETMLREENILHRWLPDEDLARGVLFLIDPMAAARYD